MGAVSRLVHPQYATFVAVQVEGGFVGLGGNVERYIGPLVMGGRLPVIQARRKDAQREACERRKRYNQAD